MLVFPNSKINLGLYVTGKREDGYHNIETVFLPVYLCDILEILPLKKKIDGKVKFTNTGIPVDCNPDKNLCVKAFQLLDADYNLPPVEIILHKAVPMGAGLGGGSADGAFTFSLLNQMFNLGISQEKLARYASEIGSDCPFFIYNTPMLGTGRGEILSPIRVNLNDYHLILVKPSSSVGTAEAYRGVKIEAPALPLHEIMAQPVHMWKGILKNSFEANIFPNHPEIERIKQDLYRLGAVYAAMSGSGSTVFGIFEKEVTLKDNFQGCFYWEGDI